jgi:hypothetical protein
VRYGAPMMSWYQAVWHARRIARQCSRPVYVYEHVHANHEARFSLGASSFPRLRGIIVTSHGCSQG